MHSLSQISEELNKRAKNYKVGGLQKIRKEIGGKSKLPSRKLFDQRTVFENWGWHYGGRTELQFNIGIEGEIFRYGVAFSLACSQSLPRIDVLIPKNALFNEFLSEYASKFSDLRMWHYDNNNERSTDSMPFSIPEELVKEGVFIFFGGKQDIHNLDYSLILETLDRLLPIYLFTEKAVSIREMKKAPGFNFKPGCVEKTSSTSGKLSRKKLNIRLKYNDIQFKLYSELVKVYGQDNVGAEIYVNGISIDLVVKNGGDYWFYEIKTASTAKSCIRQALGQILEYSYWPGNQHASKLIIVGEAEANSEENQYVDFLCTTFSIPLEYLCIKA